jgi:hypothetical protein
MILIFLRLYCTVRQRDVTTRGDKKIKTKNETVQGMRFLSTKKALREILIECCPTPPPLFLPAFYNRDKRSSIKKQLELIPQKTKMAAVSSAIFLL